MQTGFNPAFGCSSAPPKFAGKPLVDKEIDLTDGNNRDDFSARIEALAADPATESGYSDPGSAGGSYRATFKRGDDTDIFELPEGLRPAYVPKDEDDAFGPGKLLAGIKEAPFVRWIFQSD